ILDNGSLPHACEQVLIERGGLAVPALTRVYVGDIDVEIAIVIYIAEGCAHSVAVIICARRLRNIAERAIAVVVQQRIAPEVVGDVDILIAVVIVVAKRDAEGEPALPNA